MDYEELFSTDIRSEQIKKWRADGKKIVGIICCHVPFELLHAAGVCPIRLRSTGKKLSGAADAYMPQKSCGFTTTICQNLVDGTYDLDGIAYSDGCDVAMSVIGAWRSFLEKQGEERWLFQISAPRIINPASYSFFNYELEDLRDALQELSGNTITDEKLKNSIDLYNEARRLVKQVYELHKAEKPVINGEDTLKLMLAAAEMPVEEYIAHLKAFLADVPNMTPLEGYTHRVMVIGSALDDPGFVKLIEDNGCLVVADLNSFGIRFLRDELEYDESNLLGSLSKHYLTRSSCPRMMDGSDDIHDYMLTAAKEYGAQGVIMERLKYCEKWQNESYVIGETLKKADIPYLELERQEQYTGEAQLQLRIEAFKELLENR